MEKKKKNLTTIITYFTKDGRRTTEKLAFRKIVHCYDAGRNLIHSSLSIRFSLEDEW
ncbi:MAG: hypothetical protein E6713_16550 [Sporomusaceae bacterium]|nr:hypothetical protein [Sporomusaceae bacterium]